MRITDKRREVATGERQFGLRRTEGGVAELFGRDERDIACGLGFAHAHDRLVQMCLVRLVGQGRLCECLRSDGDTLDLDLLAREVGFAHHAERDVARCTDRARAFGEAYCEGVNAYLDRHRRPAELVMAGVHPEPWTVADILLTIAVMSYAGLAQSQQEVEKLIIQAIKSGAPVERLQALFAPHLDGLDQETIDALADVHIHRPVIPKTIQFAATLPRFLASNNWAVAKERSASGHALFGCDPHLEVNRLPAIWYELVAHAKDGYQIGVTMPGVPGLVMGRTAALSFGFTYGVMDTIDYFVESCRGGKYRRGDDWLDFERREEVIERKSERPVEVVIYENDHGVLERDLRRPHLEDGTYLCRAWSWRLCGAAPSLDALARLPDATDVSSAADVVREVSLSCNWLLADATGDVAYQQSGPLPLRRHSGLHPLVGWRSENDWQGLAPKTALGSKRGEALLVTANDDLNEPGKPLSINLPMAPYRADRIRELFGELDTVTVTDMRRVQNDVYSLQAERLMPLLVPLLPDTKAGRVLREWDLCYDTASRGATLFEAVYRALMAEILGRGVFGPKAWTALVDDTAILASLHAPFDQILLGDDERWFGDEGREALLGRVIRRALEDAETDGIVRWGIKRRVMMENIFFLGNLPTWLGFDHGPIELAGNPATIVQGAIYQDHGRATCFGPSYRFLTDLGQRRAHTALAGGPSGRRSSRWYLTDVERWLAGEYKTLTE